MNLSLVRSEFIACLHGMARIRLSFSSVSLWGSSKLLQAEALLGTVSFWLHQMTWSSFQNISFHSEEVNAGCSGVGVQWTSFVAPAPVQGCYTHKVYWSSCLGGCGTSAGLPWTLHLLQPGAHPSAIFCIPFAEDGKRTWVVVTHFSKRTEEHVEKIQKRILTSNPRCSTQPALTMQGGGGGSNSDGVVVYACKLQRRKVEVEDLNTKHCLGLG